MQSCGICFEELKSPVSLPCGHIFCHECLLRAINAIKSYSTLHTCPTCRSGYSLGYVDVSVVPSHLRPYVLPSVRRLYFGEPTEAPRRSSSTEEIAVENGKLNAENSALRTNCEMWRKRAEAHGVATIRLLKLARLARDRAIQMEHERDELQRHCDMLQAQLSRKKRPLDSENDPAQPASSVTTSLSSPYLMAIRPYPESAISDTDSRPMKRRRTTTPLSNS